MWITLPKTPLWIPTHVYVSGYFILYKAETTIHLSFKPWQREAKNNSEVDAGDISKAELTTTGGTSSVSRGSLKKKG